MISMTTMIGLPSWAFVLVWTLTGLVVGSFVAAESRRLILAEGGGARSCCRHCQSVLGFRDLLPVVSFVIGRGRCRHCGGAIGWRYPVIELTCCAIFTALAAFNPAVFGGEGLSEGGPVLAAGLLGGLVALLLLAAITDIEAGFIPDRATAGIAGLGVVAVVLDQAPLAPAVLAASLAFFAAWGLRRAYRWLRRRDGLGFGDVKLIGATGLWLPVDQWPLFLILAGVFGLLAAALIARSLDGALFRPLPFAPAIGGALLVSLLVRGL